MRKVALKRTSIKSLYKIVVSTTQIHQNEKTHAIIGHYDSKTKSLSLKKAKLSFYLNAGAIPTDTVRALIYKSMHLPY